MIGSVSSWEYIVYMKHETVFKQAEIEKFLLRDFDGRYTRG